jgi:hypothetical protein
MDGPPEVWRPRGWGDGDIIGCEARVFCAQRRTRRRRARQTSPCPGRRLAARSGRVVGVGGRAARTTNGEGERSLCRVRSPACPGRYCANGCQPGGAPPGEGSRFDGPAAERTSVTTCGRALCHTARESQAGPPRGRCLLRLCLLASPLRHPAAPAAALLAQGARAHLVHRAAAARAELQDAAALGRAHNVALDLPDVRPGPVDLVPVHLLAPPLPVSAALPARLAGRRRTASIATARCRIRLDRTLMIVSPTSTPPDSAAGPPWMTLVTRNCPASPDQW